MVLWLLPFILTASAFPEDDQTAEGANRSHGAALVILNFVRTINDQGPPRPRSFTIECPAPDQPPEVQAQQREYKRTHFRSELDRARPRHLEFSAQDEDLKQVKLRQDHDLESALSAFFASCEQIAEYSARYVTANNRNPPRGTDNNCDLMRDAQSNYREMALVKRSTLASRRRVLEHIRALRREGESHNRDALLRWHFQRNRESRAAGRPFSARPQWEQLDAEIPKIYRTTTQGRGVFVILEYGLETLVENDADDSRRVDRLEQSTSRLCPSMRSLR